MSWPDYPSSREGERHVLASMMFSAKATELALAELTEEQFFYRGHRLIFESIRKLFVEGRPIDPVIVKHAVSTHPEAKKIQGAIDEMIREHHGVVNVAEYCVMLRREWARREYVKALKAMDDYRRREVKTEKLIAFAEQVLVGLRQHLDAGREGFTDWSELGELLRERLENPPERAPGIVAPWHGLNQYEDYYAGGRMYVLGGWSGDGKTICAVQVAVHAGRSGKKVLFVQAEMSTADMVGRTATVMGIPYREAHTGKVRAIHRERANAIVEELKGFGGGGVIDDPTADIAKVGAYVRIMRPDMVIFDHLHQIQYRDRFDLERQVRGFAQLARLEHIPVILLAQFHRGTRDDFPRPTMKSFRESAVIEQMAARADAIYRKREDGKPEDSGGAEYIVMKNRFGRCYHFEVGLHENMLAYFDPREMNAMTGVPMAKPRT